ncbi:MAG: hypothetical protein ABSG31_09765 [Tepidisphaeraceae bacterium]|jgi:hypothetical protein
MQNLMIVVYLIATAFAFAKVEIEIEGPHGWAANLPTWRIQNAWTKLLYGHRPLTGYHVWLQAFVFMLVHLPLAMGLLSWSVSLELRLLGFIVVFFIVEDFLWFLFNPAYGLKRFKPQNIWWHAPTWWWIMPRDYWVFSVIGCGAYAVGIYLK